MISLARKAKKAPENNNGPAATTTSALPSSPSSGGGGSIGRMSIRDKLLVKEVQEMTELLPATCRVSFPDVNSLAHFDLTVAPVEGLWSGGRFRFEVSVPDEYNNVPPEVRCRTKLWHPNISEDGAICMSLLRRNAIDGFGWSPARHLKDVVWGVDALFTDLLNFDDPLNQDAADEFQRDKHSFSVKVKDYIQRHARR